MHVRARRKDALCESEDFYFFKPLLLYLDLNEYFEFLDNASLDEIKLAKAEAMGLISAEKATVLKLMKEAAAKKEGVKVEQKRQISEDADITE